MDYRLTKIDKDFWRKVKSLAALKDISIRELIFLALEEYIKRYEGKEVTEKNKK